MNCTDILPLISGHLDQANTETEEARLLEHLEGCSHCRSLLSQMQRGNALLAASAQEPPADLAQRVMARVRIPAAKPRRKRRVISWLASGAAAAALLAIVLTGALPSPKSGDDALLLDLETEYADTDNEQLPEHYAALPEDAMKQAAQPAEAGTEDADTTPADCDPDNEAAYGLNEGAGDAPHENNNDAQAPLAFRSPVAAKLDRSTPILIIWDTSAAEFEAMEGLEPDSKDAPPLLFPKEILEDEVFTARIGDAPAKSEAITAEGRQTMTMTAYTVSYDIFAAVLAACGEDYEMTVFNPELETQPESCKIIFAVACDVLPCETQAS